MFNSTKEKKDGFNEAICFSAFCYGSCEYRTDRTKVGPPLSAMKLIEKNLTEKDLEHLRHCLTLAQEALAAGDEPFGSILVNDQDEVLAEARNRVNALNRLAHPEIELAYWAADHLSPEERRQTRMYTTGEHCPMCAAAHGWVGLGEIVYLSSAAQLTQWLAELGTPAAPIQFLPVQAIIADISVKGPATGELLEEIKQLHVHYQTNRRNQA